LKPPTIAIGEGKETPSQWRLTDSPEGLSLIFAAFSFLVKSQLKIFQAKMRKRLYPP
jgi:hypothetical protein